MERRMLLASGLVVGLLAAAAPAQAGTLHVGVVLTSGSGHDHDRGRGHGNGHAYGRNAYRIGYDHGQTEGFERGREDARRHRPFDFARDRAYRHGDRGYRREYGPRPRYVAGFREGYEDGYRRGYRSANAYRHRHGGRSEWCYDRHGRDDWRDRDPYERDPYERDPYERDRSDHDGDRYDRDGRRCDPRDERCER